MDELLNNLKAILIAEDKAQETLKIIKAQKDVVLDKLNDIILVDNYANDYVTLRKKLKPSVISEQDADKFMKNVKQLDKQKIEEYYNLGKEIPGIEIEIKLIAYKKKSGLI